MLQRWEGGFQDDPADTANWVNGDLIGTKWGVTPRTLAAHRGVDPGQITRADIANLSFEEAAEIALSGYFIAPMLDELPWGPVVEAVFDFGYMSGPRNAVKQLQRILEVADDGAIGPITVRAFADWIQSVGDARALDDLCNRRIEYFHRVVARRPTSARFLGGWVARAKHYTARNEPWWSLWS